jgi:Ca-activated chloride channel family protein
VVVPKVNAVHRRQSWLVVCAALTGAAASIAFQSPQVFRAGTSVVPVYATVTDASGALADGLTASDFEVHDNGARQAISIFRSGAQPITIAVLLDTSPSLFPIAARAASAVTELAARLREDDRAVVGTFSHAVTLDPGLTHDASTLVGRLRAPAPWPAGTALWDAIDAGRLALVHEGGRRVVLIVSDGADNASRVDPAATRTALQREGVVIYAIAVRGRFGLDTSDMGALANATGGRLIELGSADDVGAAMQQVADELHHQYLIGFAATRLDDRLHRIEVKVKRRGLTVRARRAYFASTKELR